MTDEVLVERRGRTAVITLNRPDKLNAWTGPMRDTLVSSLLAIGSDDDVTAVVFTGTGRGFCAGQDLSETAAIDTSDETAATDWIDSFETLYQAVRSLDKPTVAALNGVSAGSGFQFALLSDLRVGHDGVTMGQPELLSGIPSITGIWAMWTILGRAKTTELVLTGRLLEAQEAAGLGLLTEIVPESEVLPRALELAEQLGSLPPGALALTKNRLRELEDVAFADAFDAAKHVHAAAYRTGEPQREMERFLQHRREPSGATR